MSPARYKGAHGGRGSAKSHWFASHLVERCVRKPSLRAVCIREIQKSLDQSVKRLLEDKIIKHGASAYFDVKKTHVDVKGGGIILFQGMQNHTADSIKSLEGYEVAWVEEAQTLSQTSLDLLRPTIRADGSEIWASWNPRFATDPIDHFLRHEKPEEAVVIEANFSDNPWFPDVLRREMEYDKRRDPDKYAHIWLGQYRRNSEAAVFRNWRIDEFDAPAGVNFLMGGDWGFSVDPSALVRFWIDDEQRRIYIDYEAYEVGCELDDLPALFDKVPLSRKVKIRADSSRPETISFMNKRGFRIEPSIKGTGSVEDGIEFLKSYDIIVHSRCKHTIDELTLHSFKIDRVTGKPTTVLEDAKNHTIDCLRYGSEDHRRAKRGMLSAL